MGEKSEKIESLFDKFDVGEGRLLRVVREAVADGEPIVRVEMRQLQPEPIKALPTATPVHDVYGSESFIAWIGQFAGEDSIVFWNTEPRLAFVCYFDPLQKTGMPAAVGDAFGDLARCRYFLAKHPIFLQWQKVIGLKLTHKHLLEHFKTNRADIVNASELIEGWRGVETTVNMRHDAKYDDGFHFTVAFDSKTSGKSTTATLLSCFNIVVPVLHQDDEDPTEFEIQIDIIEPETPTQAAEFRLRSRDFDFALEKAMKKELESLKEAIDLPILQGMIM